MCENLTDLKAHQSGDSHYCSDGLLRRPGDVCTDIRNKIQAAFKTRKFKSEIFLVTGGDWAWAPGTT